MHLFVVEFPRLFMFIGGIWVIISVGTHALSNAMNDFAHTLIFGEKQYEFPNGYIKYTLIEFLYSSHFSVLFRH